MRWVQSQGCARGAKGPGGGAASAICRHLHAGPRRWDSFVGGGTALGERESWLGVHLEPSLLQLGLEGQGHKCHRPGEQWQGTGAHGPLPGLARGPLNKMRGLTGCKDEAKRQGHDDFRVPGFCNRVDGRALGHIFSSFVFFFFLFFSFSSNLFIYFEREGSAGGAVREGERESPAGFAPSARSPIGGSNSQTQITTQAEVRCLTA